MGRCVCVCGVNCVTTTVNRTNREVCGCGVCGSVCVCGVWGTVGTVGVGVLCARRAVRAAQRHACNRESM